MARSKLEFLQVIISLLPGRPITKITISVDPGDELPKECRDNYLGYLKRMKSHDNLVN